MQARSRSNYLLTLALVAVAIPARVSGDDGLGESFVIVVHPDVETRRVPRVWVSRVFLKKVSRWPDGTLIRPVDLPPKDPVRKDFSIELLNRSVTAVRSFWQQAIFSGRGIPPPELDDDAAVVRYVSRTAGSIGYVSVAADRHGLATVTVVDDP